MVQPHKLTLPDLEILEKQTPQTLAEWYCELNRWNWIEAFGEAEPQKITKEADGLYHLETTRRGAIMAWVSERISEKFILRTWNKDMTEIEFEAFWLRYTT